MSNHAAMGVASGAGIALRCPACSAEVRVPAADAHAGMRVGCLHRGEESWLDRDDGEQGPGPWELLPEDYDGGE